MRTWSEHLAWCKQRALERLDAGDPEGAVASMEKDLQQHPLTRLGDDNVMWRLGQLYLNHGDAKSVRRWIEGFR